MSHLYEAVSGWLDEPVGRRYAEPYGKLWGAVVGIAELHEPVDDLTYPPREVEAYDKDGKPLGVTVQVPGDPLPGVHCRHCRVPMPCPTIQAVAKGLGIEA